MQGTTIINGFGQLKGWNSIIANLLGRDLEGITELAYDDNVEKTNIMGAGEMPVGRGRGNYTAKASITLLIEEVDGIMVMLPPGKRLQDIEPFDIIVHYQRKDGVIQTDIIRNVEFINNGVEVKQGDQSIAKKLDLVVSHIDWNVAA